MGTIFMASDLNGLPGGEVLIDRFGGVGELRFQLTNRFLDLRTAIVTILQFGQFSLEVENGLLES